MKLTRIRLHIGDESYETPDMKERMLLAAQNVNIQMSAGHVEQGVTRIRQGRYRKNRIEVSFELHTSSIENTFRESKPFVFEIDVLVKTPQAVFRPEWTAT